MILKIEQHQIPKTWKIVVLNKTMILLYFYVKILVFLSLIYSSYSIDFFSALYLMAHFFATSIPASNVNFSQFGENKGNGFKRSKFYKQQNV